MAINGIPPPDVLIASAAASGSSVNPEERLLTALVTGRANRAALLADLGSGRAIKLETPLQFEQGTQLKLAVTNAANTARILTAVSPDGQRLPLQSNIGIPIEFLPASSSGTAAVPAGTAPAPGPLPQPALGAPMGAPATPALIASSTVSVPANTAPAAAPAPPLADGAPARTVTATASYQAQVAASSAAPSGHQAVISTVGHSTAVRSPVQSSSPPASPLATTPVAHQGQPLSAKPDSPPSQPMRPELIAMVKEALPVQAPSAGLFALAQGLSSAPPVFTPAPLNAAIGELLGFRRPIAEMTDPALLKQAIMRSGSFQEGQILGGRPMSDLKSVLLQLEQLVQSGPRQAGADRPASPSPPPRPGSVASASPAVAAATVALPSMQGLLGDLGSAVIAALSRVRLMQFASLPPSPTDSADPAPIASQHWMGELPVLINDKTALIYFDMERHPDDQDDTETPGDAWIFNLALDSDPDGAIYAKIKLVGTTLSVSLWAKEGPTASAFLGRAGRLKAELAEMGLTVSDIAVHLGWPSEAVKPAPGRHEVDAQT